MERDIQVFRQALVARLLASAAPLVVISAPAGWGKTTVLRQWAENDPRPSAWLQLDASHNDPAVVVSGLAAALERVAPVDPMVAKWTRLALPPLRERILPSLRVSLQEALPFLLVLDDAQMLTNKASWEIIDILSRAFSTGAQLALATRKEPGLPMGRLEAAGQVLEIGAADLAFDTSETAELLCRGGLDADVQTAAALQAATEGWAAGISLAAHACDGGCTPEWVASIRGDHHAIARYLKAEVFERQSRPVRSFLLETSILDRLSVDACREVARRTDAGDVLAQLERGNVFVTPLDGNGESYRYHRLFAELLRSELRRHDATRLPELHHRAAGWYEEQGDLEASLRHWLAAGEAARARDVLYRAYFLCAGKGEFETLQRLLTQFSHEQSLTTLPLALAAGAASLTDDPWMTRVRSDPTLREQIDDTPPPYGGGTQRLFDLCHRVLLADDGVTQMRRDAERAAELVAELAAGDLPVWKAAVNSMLGIACWLSGDNAGARSAFNVAINSSHSHNLIPELGANAYLALLLADEGHWEEAEARSARTLLLLQQAELTSTTSTVLVRLPQARVLAHMGAPEAGEHVRAVEAALAQLRLPPWAMLTAAVILGEVALERGDLAEAERWTASGFATLATWADAGIFRRRAERLRRTIQEQRLAAPLTKMEQRALDLLPTYLTTHEIAIKLHVSQNTLKTHLRNLYRKIGAHSRSEAVQRAQELKLLKS